MKNFKTSPGIICNGTKGFGFAELLVVIAVVGVLSGVAIPALSGIFGRAETSKTDRNAQSLVATFNAARAAGNITNYADAEEAIDAITTSPGIQGSGVYATNSFYVPMAPSEITEAATRIAPALFGGPDEGVLIITPR